MSNELTTEQRATKLRNTLTKATRGPWVMDELSLYAPLVHMYHVEIARFIDEDKDELHEVTENSRFMIAAREHIGAILDEREALIERVKELESSHTWILIDDRLPEMETKESGLLHYDAVIEFTMKTGEVLRDALDMRYDRKGRFLYCVPPNRNIASHRPTHWKYKPSAIPLPEVPK